MKRPKTIVVYYSLFKHSKKIAELIAKQVGCKAVSIKEKPMLNWYEKVYIGGPVWAWDFAPKLKKYILRQNLTKKKVRVFISCGGQPGRTKAWIKKVLEAKDAKLEKIIVFKDLDSKKKRMEKAGEIV